MKDPLVRRFLAIGIPGPALYVRVSVTVVDFAFSEEQQMLRDQARSLLAERFTDDVVAGLADSEPGWDPSSWRVMAELGWTGLSIPQRAGGAGMGFLEEAVLLEELAYALYPGPYFSTIGLALPALASNPGVARRVAAGELTVGIAAAEPGGQGTIIEGASSAAWGYGEPWTLFGTKELVADAGIVDAFAVIASSDEMAGVWLVDAEDDGVTLEVHSTIDSTRRFGTVALDGAVGELLVEPGRVGDGMVLVLHRRALAVAALEAVGVARRAVELAVEHAKARKQFGKPIGVYQAVAHQIVDMYVDLELARSLAYWAAWSVAEEVEEAAAAAAAAKAFATDAAVRACERSIQVHGGIGFTWEHPLHRYYKRAQWLHAFQGHPSGQRGEVSDVLLDR